MKKYVLFLIGGVTLLFSSCSHGNADFNEYCDKLPFIKLPATISCGLCGNDTSVSKSQVEKYAFKGAQVIGRLDDDKKIYIVYNYPGDICYPYLYTYNSDGKVLDSLYLHINTCADDEYLSFRTSSVIHPDKSINMVDTENYFSIDSSIMHRRFQIATVIRKRTYQINSSGIPKLSVSTKDSTPLHKLAP